MHVCVAFSPPLSPPPPPLCVYRSLSVSLSFSLCLSLPVYFSGIFIFMSVRLFLSDHIGCWSQPSHTSEDASQLYTLLHVANPVDVPLTGGVLDHPSHFLRFHLVSDSNQARPVPVIGNKATFRECKFILYCPFPVRLACFNLWSLQLQYLQIPFRLNKGVSKNNNNKRKIKDWCPSSSLFPPLCVSTHTYTHDVSIINMQAHACACTHIYSHTHTHTHTHTN